MPYRFAILFLNWFLSAFGTEVFADVSFPECANLTRELVQNLVAESSNKTDYFNRLRARTTLTAHREKETPLLADIHLALSSTYFIGDSIVQELGQRYHLLWPHIKTPRSFIPEPRDLLSLNDSNIAGSDCVVVGGNAIHMALRNRNMNNEPFRHHESAVLAILREMRHLRDEFGKRVVYIGSVTVDPQLMLHPAKGDWDGFHEFELLEIWNIQDKRLCAELRIPFFDTMELVRQCPGVRCDGMHFGSDFSQWGCHSSAHLWDRLWVDFAKHYLL